MPEVSVLIDFDTLRDGLHDHSVCETSTGEPVPAATIRRLCCDADIIPVVLDGDGVTLDVGRAKRVATREQRRALRAMYRTCAHPGCTVGFDDCDIHHVNPWTPTGLTDLDNLLPLCSRHHHLVHEGGWTLILRADRTTVWCRPDGTIHYDGSTVDVAPAGVALSEIPEHLRRAAEQQRRNRDPDDERRLELLNGLTQTPRKRSPSSPSSHTHESEHSARHHERPRPDPVGGRSWKCESKPVEARADIRVLCSHFGASARAHAFGQLDRRCRDHACTARRSRRGGAASRSPG